MQFVGLSLKWAMAPRSVLVSFATLLLACLLVVAVFMVGFDALPWRGWLNLPRMPSLAIRTAAATFVAGAGVLVLRYLLADIPDIPPSDLERQTTSPPVSPRRCFWIVCALLAAAALAPAPVAWRSSEDVRNFFPLIAALTTLVTFVYAFVYSVIAYVGRFPLRTVVVQHVVVGTVQIALTLLFFVLERPKWGGPEAWRNQLTPLQAIVFNHATPWLVYAFSLVAALLIAITARHRTSSG